MAAAPAPVIAAATDTPSMSSAGPSKKKAKAAQSHCRIPTLLQSSQKHPVREKALSQASQKLGREDTDRVCLSCCRACNGNVSGTGRHCTAKSIPAGPSTKKAKIAQAKQEPEEELDGFRKTTAFTQPSLQLGSDIAGQKL